MLDQQQQIQAAILALEARRTTLGAAVVDAAVASLRAELVALVGRSTSNDGAPVLRQATILFIDIVGSTTLGERLDPEEISASIGSALAEFTAVVNARGGKELQYAGDCLLAVFGAVEAREDDAERAVRCGLDLLEAGRRFRELVKGRHGFHGFDVRVGVHTGGVLFGAGPDAWNRVSGQAVNIAARMEQTAPPGALRISHATYLHVRGIFDVQPQPPLSVKGVDEPVLTYLVVGVKPRAFRNPARGIEGIEVRLIGRDRELSQLTTMLDDVVSQRHARIVAIIGEPGTGKSRLLQELQSVLDMRADRSWLLMARADPLSQMQPYGVLRALLAWRFEIADSDSSAVAKAKLVEALAPWLEERGEAKAHMIGRLVGMDFDGSPHLHGLEPRQLRALAFSALREYLRNLGADGAIVAMLLEDLHWADDDSLDFIAELHSAADMPLALIATARPAFLERRPSFGSDSTNHRVMPLAALDAGDSRALARTLLQRIESGVEPIEELLVAQAEGNPFYMEELVRMLIDDGVIDASDERWRVQLERLRTSKVPTTLVGVLQARIDALAAADRRALQQASIVGHVFWDAALAELDVRAVESIPALRRRSLVVQNPTSAFEGAREDSFHHHLLHQVTYETVLKAERRAGHARAASWLAERVGDRPAEYLAITAEHYARAGDEVHAFDYFARAADYAEERFANRAALEYSQRALRMNGAADPARRGRLYGLQERVADLLGQRALQEAALEERAKIADALDDDALRAGAMMSRALLASRRGDETRSYEFAVQAVALAQRSGASDVASLGLGQMAWSCYTKGDSQSARRYVTEALASVRAAMREEVTHSRRTREVQTLTVLGIVELGDGHHKQAIATLLEARSLARAAGLRRPLSSALEILGSTASNIGRYAEALSRFEESLALTKEMGWSLAAATAGVNVARCCRELGHLERAARELDVAEKEARGCENPHVIAQALLLRGRMFDDAGESASALSVFEEALAIVDATDEPVLACVTRAHIADVHRRRGDLTEATALVERIARNLADGVKMSSMEEPFFPRLICYRVWAERNDPRAATMIESLHTDLLAFAARSGDEEMRTSILEKVPLHRDIVAAWEAHRVVSVA